MHRLSGPRRPSTRAPGPSVPSHIPGCVRGWFDDDGHWHDGDPPLPGTPVWHTALCESLADNAVYAARRAWRDQGARYGRAIVNVLTGKGDRVRLAILLLALIMLAAPDRAEARPVSTAGLVYSGYSTVDTWLTGDRGPDYTGRMCYGEDSQNKTQLSGIMAPGEVAVVLPYVCQALYQDGSCCIPGTGGGIGFRVYAYAKGQGTAQLAARIVTPTGQVVTHNDNLVCYAPQVWRDVEGQNAPVGEVGLDGGTYRLEVENWGGKDTRGTVILFEMFMSYIFETTCPEGDVTWIGH